MENASKALIIAGAILLAILIISLGILIYNQAAGIANGNAMSEVEITEFNTQFTQYQGTQSGTSVRYLLQKVVSSNLNDNNEGKEVTVTGDVDIAPTDNDPQIETISTGKRYTVTFEYNDQGLIDTINIAEL